MMLRRGHSRLARLIAIASSAFVQFGCGRDSAEPHAAAAADRQQTAAAVSQAQPLPSENIEKSLAAAQSYLDSQEIEKAQSILLTLIDRAPGEVRAREMLGQSYVFAALNAHNRGEVSIAADLRRKAYEQYKIATELSPHVAGLHHSAGLMAMQAGHPRSALTHFQAAERLDRHNPQYPLYAAQLLIQTQRFDEADAALHRVLALDPDEPLAHASLAMIALEQSDFEQAVMRISEARRIKPDDLALRVQEAKIRRRMGDPQRGLELMIGLSAADRAQDMVAFEIAASFDQLNKPMEAAKAWQHVFQSNQLAPRAWLAAVRSGEFLIKAGERERAAWWLQQAQMAAPDAPEVKALAELIRAPADAMR
jgi:tetratricopeptide (TPR) repeat protein